MSEIQQKRQEKAVKRGRNTLESQQRLLLDDGLAGVRKYSRGILAGRSSMQSHMWVLQAWSFRQNCQKEVQDTPMGCSKPGVCQLCTSSCCVSHLQPGQDATFIHQRAEQFRAHNVRNLFSNSLTSCQQSAAGTLHQLCQEPLLQAKGKLAPN